MNIDNDSASQSDAVQDSSAGSSQEPFSPLEAAMDALGGSPEVREIEGDLMADFASELMGGVTDGDQPDATQSTEKTEPTEPTEPTETKGATEPDEPAIPEKPKNKDDWNILRGSRDKYKAAAEEKERTVGEKQQRIELLEKELEEVRARAARAAELEERAKIADEYEKELAVTRVEATVDYKQNILKPLSIVAEQAEILAKSNEHNVDEVYQVLKEPDPAKQRQMLRELTIGWDELDRLDLKKLAEDSRELLNRQDEILRNAKEANLESQKLSSQREEQARANAQKEFVTATDAAIKSLREKVPFIPLSEGETENDRFALLKDKLKNVDFEAQSPRGKAFAAATALMYPQMVRMMNEQAKEIASLREAVAKKGSTRVSMSPTEVSTDEVEEDFFKSFGIQEPATMFGSTGSLDVRG